MTTTVTVEENNINVTLSDGVSPSSAQLALLQTLAGLAGLANFNGSGSASAIKVNLSATAAPTSGDDSGDGYTVGSIWVDTTNDNAYICTDATLGAANWERINAVPVDVDDLTTTTGTVAQRLRVAADGGLEYRTTEQDLADLRDAGALATPDIGVTVQGYDADLAAIAALSPSNDDVVQRKAGAWTNRTIAQLKTDLAVLPEDASIVAVSSGRDLASTDAGKILECTGTFTLTCPNGLDAGLQCVLVNVGSGTITIAATTTLQSKDGATTMTSQYGMATVYHRGSNVWLLGGDIS